MKGFLAPALFIGSIAAPFFVLASALGQAPAEQEDWEHLYRGSRLLVSKYSAWRVSEPIRLEPKNVYYSVLSERNGQGILMARRSTPDLALGEDIGESNEDRPPLFYVIDLKSGRVKKIEPPAHPFTWLTPFHPGGRLFQGSVSLNSDYGDLAPPQQEFVCDARTGKVFIFNDRIQRIVVYSSLPEVVCYRRVSDHDGERVDFDLATYDLVDFSVLPPRHTIHKLTDDGDPSEVLDEDLCLLFESKDGVTGKRSYWKRQIETGRHTAITESEFIEKRNRTGFNDERSGLSLESGKPDESFLQLPWDGIRPRLLLEAGADYWDSAGNPPTFLAVHQGLARLYHVSKVDHRRATDELYDHAKKAARGYATQVTKRLRRWSFESQGKLPSAPDELRKAAEGSVEDEILMKFVWSSAAEPSRSAALSEIEIAHLPGPTGRAAIFADFHVEWLTRR